MMTLKFKEEKNVTIFFCCKKPKSSIFLKSGFKMLTRTGSHCNRSRTPWGLLGADPSPSHVPHLPLVCRKTLASQAFPKFQRVNLIREVRKCRKKEKEDKIIIVQPFNKVKDLLYDFKGYR